MQDKIHIYDFKLGHLAAVLLIGFTMLACQSASGQGLHFSQFYNTPLSTNPANTGFIPDADYRVGVTYRNQYSSIMDIPYTTYSAFGDVQLFRDRIENGWVGVGGFLMGDKAGSGALQSTKAYGSVAYHQLLGYSSLLSAGFNVGYVNKRIDPTRLKFPDQFDGKFFDGQLGTSVMLSNTSASYLDVQAGMNYAYFPTEDVYVNAGYSLMHANKPKESFFADKTEVAVIPFRHTAFVNAILKVADNVIINPNVYYSNQAGASEIVGGLTANYNLSEFGSAQLIGGLYYRYKDAVIPVAGFETNNLIITASYDVTTSSLNNFNNGRGAAEISIVKKGFNSSSGPKQYFCPKF